VSSVLIRGDGIAAACCAHLLSRADVPVIVERADRPKLPAIMLSEAAQKLLGDVFDRRDAFAGLTRIRKRVVAWGKTPEPIAVPHSAVVVSEQELLDRLRPESSGQTGKPDPEATWTIFSSRPLPPSSQDRHFGSRLATASPAVLRAGAETDACWIESLERGWLFLLPECEKAWLLSVGGAVDELLAESQLISGQIAEVGRTSGSFPSHPRIAEPLCEPGWLACGTAALGFDPLCGDGAGHAAREAILASAVVRAGIAGADVSALVAHYRTRLLAGFNKHLLACREFYEAGHGGSWWDQELDSLDSGLKWCSDRLQSSAAFRFRLNGFALEAID
jgi:hypothetical protein